MNRIAKTLAIGLVLLFPVVAMNAGAAEKAPAAKPDKAKAEFEHGVLTLTLPKAEVVKPKQIKITAK